MLGYRDFVMGDVKERFCGIGLDGATHCAGGASFVPPQDHRYVQLAILGDGSDDAIACGLLEAGQVECWGGTTPVDVPSGEFLWISGGHYMFAGVKRDGSLAFWSWPAGVDHTLPPTGTFTQIFVGDLDFCALRDDGTGVCWDTLTPSGVTQLPDHYLRVYSFSRMHRAGIASDGTLREWWPAGRSPTPLPSGTYIDLALEDAGGCAIRSDGAVMCWGGSSSAPVGLVAKAN
jgi:hypothetical protein